MRQRERQRDRETEKDKDSERTLACSDALMNTQTPTDKDRESHTQIMDSVTAQQSGFGKLFFMGNQSHFLLM